MDLLVVHRTIFFTATNLLWSSYYKVFMDWLSSIDFSHLWNWIIAQTPTPIPIPSPLPTPAKNLNDIELLTVV